MAKPYGRPDRSDAACLRVDHQAGLLSLLRDIDPDRFKNNVLALDQLPMPVGMEGGAVAALQPAAAISLTTRRFGVLLRSRPRAT